MKSLFLMSALLGFAQMSLGAVFEYRMQVYGNGKIYKWKTGTKVLLDKSPFLTKTDFTNASVKKSDKVRQKGSYVVHIGHSSAGETKFTTKGNSDRDRSYCILLDNVVVQCLTFPPKGQKFSTKNSEIFGNFSKKDAESLAGKINASIK